MFGDFNTVRYKEERKGSIFNAREAIDFNEFINNLNLNDLPLGGRRFTWMTKDGRKLSKIDRIMVSSSILSMWPNVSVSALPVGASDHCPLLLNSHVDSVVNSGPKPFKFFNAWMGHPDFAKLVEENWAAPINESMIDMAVKEKLKRLKFAIRPWVSIHFGRMDLQIKDLQDKIDNWESMAELSTPSDVEVAIHMSNVHLLMSLQKQKSSMLKQKSRVKWAIKGDENTRFFHSMMRSQQCRPSFSSNNFLTLSDLDSESDFINCAMEFSRTGIFVRGSNSSFITHILKNQDPLGFKDYRPISLIGCMYKIVETILSKKQIDRKKMFLFKVNFERAFDSIGWTFLDDVLRQMNFGIRQGDPLSPFLFLIAIEALNVAMKEAVDSGIFKGISLGRNNVIISHLQYADDALFFGEWSIENASNLIRILNCFGDASGLHINMAKSKFYGVHVMNAETQTLATLLACTSGSFPFRYLGMPVGDRISSLNVWGEVVKNFTSKLNNWKANLLSVGGRLTLIKAILSNLPIYLMLLYKIPSGILDSLEAIRRNFLWNFFDKKGITWVNWDQTRALIQKGGLGIGSLKAKNLSLLGKWWWWRFRSEPESLWAKVIQSIYGIDGGLGTLSNCWITLVPRKVNLFIWCLCMERISTRSNLMKRGIAPPSVNCPFCDNGVEDSEHLFCNCGLTKPLWCGFMSWWGISGSVPTGVISDITDSCFDLGSADSNLARLAARYVLLWATWKWRNKVIHAPVE
ncbi:uncharacterized protein [Rutidosis leptorrhynchoides]|uniref:uncharacterized protein n=1 Tax=Rutidosis leptorrhynchoides TaxID=125765 RepID=UPI003A994F3C